MGKGGAAVGDAMVLLMPVVIPDMIGILALFGANASRALGP